MKKKIQTVILILFCLLLAPQTSSALEATFTPAPDKDTGSTDGPLPLSQNQRQQLHQLDQQIAQSPNPTETLQRVAEANGMDASELGDLLMRNRRDLQMAMGGGVGGGRGGGSSVGNSIPRAILRLFSTFLLVIMKAMSAHPRSSALVVLVLLSTLYVMISAPRSGIVLSGGSGILSSGFTTVLCPPTEYISKYLQSDKFDRLEQSVPLLEGRKKRKKAWENVFLSQEELEEDETLKDGVHIMKLNKQQKKDISLAIMAKKTVPFEVLLPSEEELELLHEREKQIKEHRPTIEDDDELMQLVEERAWEDSVELAFQSAESIVAARRFSEFISDSNSSPDSMKFVARGDEREKAALVMKSMGDWKRYGIQPLKVVEEEKSQDTSSVVYYTLQGGHFDGQLKVAVEKDNEDKSHPRITVIVSLLIPKGGRKIGTKLASQMVSMLAESITTSTMTVARQTCSRKLQSTIYRDKAKSRAILKRHIAFETMQKMEEMAADRRRRWQRKNVGSGGSYRPTGCRPPEGGPRYGF